MNIAALVQNWWMMAVRGGLAIVFGLILAGMVPEAPAVIASTTPTPSASIAASPSAVPASASGEPTAEATPDPGMAFGFARPWQPARNAAPSRAPGSLGELRLVRARVPGREGIRVAVFVEGGLPVAVRSFARTVNRVLNDPRGWRQAGYAFRIVRTEVADMRIVLASPALTDTLCAPLLTLGRYSCAQGDRAVLNFERWRTGAPAYASLARYRTYMINHEIGHLLGHGHADCSASGSPAPVMVQQTKGVAPCRPNPWPLSFE